jgi:heme ABC exporter ATP-binding subunit CcmA
MLPVVSLRDAVVIEHGFPLLSGVSADFAAGEVHVLTGANGAGKTSLLRLLAGLVPLSSGSGEVTGISLSSENMAQLRRNVGWLGHEGSFYGDLTVRENLNFATKAIGRPLGVIDEALERVGLSHRGQTLTKQLSAGQRRRLGLSWLLIRRPPLWLLDEPYASLDEEGKNFFDDLLGHVVDQGASVVLSAHDPLRAASLSPITHHMVGGAMEESA